jgi:hypothetical protein
MALSVRKRIDTLIHTHVGYNPEELVFIIGDMQRDNIMRRIGP